MRTTFQWLFLAAVLAFSTIAFSGCDQGIGEGPIEDAIEDAAEEMDG